MVNTLNISSNAMKTITVFSTLAILLASCQVMSFDDEETTTEPTKGEKAMHFRLSTYSMSSIDDLPNSDDHITTGDDDDTRASTNQQNLTDHLLLGIYDAENNLVDTIIYQDKDDPGISTYGTFTHTLKYGKYTLIALGWNGDQKCTVHYQDSISFSEGWVPHTFLCRQNVIVSESYSDTRSLSLKRCVAKFTLLFKDASRPQEVSDFVFRFSGAGNALNSTTKHCTEPKDFTRTIPVNTDLSKIDGISSYCFLPEDSTGLTISLTAHDANGNVLGEKTFEKVPMKINYETKYSGNFFPYESFEGSIEIDTNYDGEFNFEF